MALFERTAQGHKSTEDRALMAGTFTVVISPEAWDFIMALPDRDQNAVLDTIEALENDPLIGPHVYQAGIRQCIDLNYATASHQTIWEYAPRSRAADDYTRLLDYVEKQSKWEEQYGEPIATAATA